MQVLTHSWTEPNKILGARTSVRARQPLGSEKLCWDWWGFEKMAVKGGEEPQHSPSNHCLGKKQAPQVHLKTSCAFPFERHKALDTLQLLKIFLWDPFSLEL